MQPPNEAPVTIFAIIVLWFYGLNFVRGMPDQVGHDEWIIFVFSSPCGGE